MRIERKGLISLAIFLVSVIIILAWGQFSPEAFLFDDNRTQWFPVIEKTYEHLFENGYIPFYNFYLFKGLAIAEPGYYGTMNPVMLISYVLSNYTFIPFSTITIYISILFALGNVAMFALSRKLGCSTKAAIMIVAAYSACSAFSAFSYWYYVFNNYFFIPLLLYTIVKSENTKFEYFACGTILAFEILMGNVQYTCYHYMMYCIICVSLIIFKPRYIKVMLSNIATGLVLSVPSFALLLNASAGGFEGKNGFMAIGIDVLSLLINSVIPGGILEEIGITLPLPNNQIMGREDRTLFYTAPLFIPILIFVFHLVSKVLKNDKSEQVKSARGTIRLLKENVKTVYNEHKTKSVVSLIPVGIFLAGLFFFFFVTRGFVAGILNCIPVINNFRFLFKTFFVIVPILSVIMAVLHAKSSDKIKKAAGIVCITLTIIGFVNNYFTVSVIKQTFESTDNMTYPEEVEYAESLIEEKELDLTNYRSFAIYQSNLYTPEKFDYSHNLTRNFPAYIEKFSLLAYEISGDTERLENTDMLVDTEKDYSVYANAGTISYFYHNLLENHTETIYQLSENSIKYLILEKPTSDNQGTYEIYENIDYIGEIIDLFERSGLIEIERVEDFGESHTLIVLDGVDALCVNENNESVSLSDERMDLLSFTPDKSETYKLSFAYDKNLVAYQLDDDGQKCALDIEESERGNITVNNVIADRGTVFISYDNPVNNLGLISEIVISAAFIAVIAFLILKRDKAKQ